MGGDVAQVFAQNAIHVPEAIRVSQELNSILQLIDGSELRSGNLSLNKDSSSPEVTNSKGEPYPQVIDPRTGEPIPPPPNDLDVVDMELRADPLTAAERHDYITEWHNQGFPRPEGGWGAYDLHHIIPRRYGGTNEFDNIVPVLRETHQKQFNSWWNNYRK